MYFLFFSPIRELLVERRRWFIEQLQQMIKNPSVLFKEVRGKQSLVLKR
jgi:hypothetical protein